MKMRLLAVGLFVAMATSGRSQAHFDSGSTGADGALTVADSTTFVLNMDAHADGVFNYTSVSIGVNATLQLEANARNTPLVILVQNNFTMSGGARILLNGSDGTIAGGAMAGQGGVGGFPGGLPGEVSPVPKAPGPGLGPGGGESIDSGDPDGTGGGRNTHMRPSLVPLIGGSGGGGGFAIDSGAGGGGGGGAILIAVNGIFDMGGGTLIDVSGGNGGYQLFGANGGGGGGSGGACRIIAGEIRGGSLIDASGGTGGSGQANGVDGGQGEEGIIRLETFRLTRNFANLNGRVFNSLPGLVNADATDIGSLRISQIGGVSVPINAGGNIALPAVQIPAGVANPIRIVVEATNVTPGQSAMIRLNYNANGGQIIEALTGPLNGTNSLSTAFADISLPAGVGTVAAVLETPAAPPRAVASSGPTIGAASGALANMRVMIDGDPVSSMETVSVLGSPGSQIVYKTRSGKSAAYSTP